jgi:hypothetical protein
MSECDLRRLNEPSRARLSIFISGTAGGLVGTARREILKGKGEPSEHARHGQRFQAAYKFVSGIRPLLRTFAREQPEKNSCPYLNAVTHEKFSPKSSGKRLPFPASVEDAN